MKEGLPTHHVRLVLAADQIFVDGRLFMNDNVHSHSFTGMCWCVCVCLKHTYECDFVGSMLGPSNSCLSVITVAADPSCPGVLLH